MVLVVVVVIVAMAALASSHRHCAAAATTLAPRSMPSACLTAPLPSHTPRPAGHLDLKLDNLLVAYDGRCVLTDFGISRVYPTEQLTLTYAEPWTLLMNR